MWLRKKGSGSTVLMTGSHHSIMILGFVIPLSCVTVLFSIMKSARINSFTVNMGIELAWRRKATPKLEREENNEITYYNG